MKSIMISNSKRHNKYNNNKSNTVSLLLLQDYLFLFHTIVVVILIITITTSTTSTSTGTSSSSNYFVHSFSPTVPVVAPAIIAQHRKNNYITNILIQKSVLNNKKNNNVILSTTSTTSTKSTTISNNNNVYKSNNNNINKYNTTKIWTKEQLLDYAQNEGILLSLTTFGPAYRAIARAKHNTTLIIGYIEGFIRPSSLVPLSFFGTNNILHLDKMQVFKKILIQCRSENPIEFTGGGTKLGVGLLLGYLCLLHSQQSKQKCATAEFLAINDEEYQHKRLVKYYTTCGFTIIKYVDDETINSIPDRLLWGGCGTLLRNNIQYLLQFWSYLLEKSLHYKASRLNRNRDIDE